MPNAALIFTIIDAVGHSSKLVRYVADNLPNQGRYFAMARNLADKIDLLTSGQVISMNVSFSMAVPGTLKQAPDPNSDVEESGRFNFVGENGFGTSVTIPAFKEEYVVPGTRTIDLTDADVDDWIDANIIGEDDDDTVAVNLQPLVDGRGDDITGIRDAYEYHGKDRGRVG